jgi:hypothetical protein
MKKLKLTKEQEKEIVTKGFLKDCFNEFRIEFRDEIFTEISRQFGVAMEQFHDWFKLALEDMRAENRKLNKKLAIHEGFLDDHEARIDKLETKTTP